jgi:hypothetical protein
MHDGPHVRGEKLRPFSLAGITATTRKATKAAFSDMKNAAAPLWTALTSALCVTLTGQSSIAKKLAR